MAQLFRVCSLHDSLDTVTLSFVVPPQAGLHNGTQEILSRQLTYAGHRWRLVLSKRDGTHLSPYLQLTDPALGLACSVDYSLCLINRDSFTQSERFQEKQCHFSSAAPRHGRRTFVSLDDLYRRKGFTDRRRNEYLMELTLRGAHTFFESRVSLVIDDKVDERRYDTNTFNYAHSEWQAVFCPNHTGEGQHLVQLRRLNKSNLLTRLKYTVTLGNKSCPKHIQSPVIDGLFDFNGDGEGFLFAQDYHILLDEGNTLLITLQLYSGYSVSQLKLNSNPELKTSASCLDPEQQTWKLSASIVGEYLYLTLFYSDVGNIPVNYLRYIRCNCSLIPSYRFERKTQRTWVEENPIENYYALQLDGDKGIRLPTTIRMRDIRDPKSPWTDVDGKYTVEIGWEASELLMQPHYSLYDDVTRRHSAQMRREVEALQRENQSLEKELHTYHLNVSSRCSSSAENKSFDDTRRIGKDGSKYGLAVENEFAEKAFIQPQHLDYGTAVEMCNSSYNVPSPYADSDR